MPTRALSPCLQPGCPVLCHGGYCDAHRRQRQQRIDHSRGTSAQRGYGYRWQQARRAFLAEHPLCVECEKDGKVSPATEVDHIQAHNGDDRLFWDRSNWQGLCKECHSRKTAREDGRFGKRGMAVMA